MQDHATIPEALGLFLPTTWRLHPAICRFISGAVYEDRLEPEPGTSRRVVRVPPKGVRWVPGEARVLFVPVEHEGNTQASDEEVARIRAIWRELKGREVADRKGKVVRERGLDDVIFVAPYNMQVRMLRQALPAGAKVGSVDKFQGQEAPVVVVSLCTSFGESGPRGLDFVLDKSRLNVAISRAQSLAIVVGDPRLARSPCGTVEQMAQLNLLCRLLEEGRPG